MFSAQVISARLTATTLAAAMVATAPAAMARDTFLGPRIEVRGSYAELLANNYDAGYCYAYYGSSECASYPSKKLGDETTLGAEVGYDRKLGSAATIGVYGRFDIGSGTHTDGDITFKPKSNFAIGLKAGFGRQSANWYLKLGYQNWSVDTILPTLSNDPWHPAAPGPTLTASSHLGGVDIATGVDVRVSQRFYVGAEIGGGVLGRDSSGYGLDTTLKSLRLAVKLGTHF